MTKIIHFDAEFDAVAVEIENIGSGRMLTAKSQAGLLPAQRTPQ
jgi:hypothetical protein